MASGDLPEEGEISPDQVSAFCVCRPDGSAEVDYVLGCFTVPGRPEEEPLNIPVILVSIVADRLLLAVPAAAWHRLRQSRLLPADSLTRPIQVSCVAVRELDRESVEEGATVRIWIGFLKPEFETCVSFEAGREFSVGFVSETGLPDYVPSADSLVALADEKFSFLSAESGAAEQDRSQRRAPQTVEERLGLLEESLIAIKTSLQDLSRNKSGSPSVKPAPGVTARKETAVLSGDGLVGLPPHVVEAASAAGISLNHLQAFSQMAAKHRPNLTDVPGKTGNPTVRPNILGETDEEAEAEDLLPTGDQISDPVQQALVKLTRIVDSLASKKKTRLEDVLLDDSAAADTSSSVSTTGSSRRHAILLANLRKALKDSPGDLYRVIENRMEADFGCPEFAPGEVSRRATFRGWVEHRSKIPNIPSTVRMVWSVAGALDSLRANRIQEAQARLALVLSQVDQLAVDRGQWVLAAEASLEDSPPFSSFARHSPPDMLEPQHTRLWPTAWAEAFMHKVRELDEFVERRQKLGKRTSQNQKTMEDEPKNIPKKQQKGKGGKASSSDASASHGKGKLSSAEASLNQTA